MPPKNSTQDTQSIEWSGNGLTVGTQGVDLRVSPRNRSPEALEELVNAAWLDESTFGRRHGHLGTEVLDGTTSGVAYTPSGTLSDLWVMGHGSMYLGESEPQVQGLHFKYPGRLQGIAARGDELVAWTGDRLLVKPDELTDAPWTGASNAWIPQTTGESRQGVPAVIPTARTYPVSTTNPPPLATTTSIDSSLGRKYVVVAYTGDALGGDDAPVMVMVMDRATKTPVFETSLSADDATSIRAVYSNQFHIVYWVSGGKLKRAYASEYDPATWTIDSDQPDIAGGYDIAYVSETTHLVVWVATGSPAKILGTYFQGANNVFQPFTADFEFDLSSSPPSAGKVGVAVAPSGDVGLVWEAAAVSSVVNAYARIYTDAGTPRIAKTLIADITNTGSIAPRALCIAAKYLPAVEDGFSEFVVYANRTGGAAKDYVASYRLTVVNTVQHGQDRYHCYLASRAFRTGQNVSVWLMTPFNTSISIGAPVPTNLFMVTGREMKQQVCGFADVGLTFNYSLCLPSVWPDPAEETYGFVGQPNTRRWGTASLYRQAISGFGSDRVAMFYRDIDMLPDNFRTAQYGKALYIAGAAVREWDGVSLVESGVGIAPYSTFASANSTGHLGDVETVSGSSAAAIYNYRTYLTWKNAQGEISRLSPRPTPWPGRTTPLPSLPRRSP